MIFKTGQHFLALNDTEVGLWYQTKRERERRREKKEREREPFYRDW